MAVWSEGYFTDTEYTDAYFADISPLMLNLNLTLAGFKTKSQEDITPSANFNYLELAFGVGSSINIHAVTTDGNYLGTDFNPAQVAFASDCIVSENITLRDDSFKEFLERLERENKMFDFICFHGIFSWISEENRQIILEIVRKFLKVGGVVYNSYNCLPGWAPKMPSKEILAMFYKQNSSMTETNSESVQKAISFLARFLDTKPSYMENTPHNKALLDQIKTKDANYLAHEYFNQNWDVFYFHDIAKMMESAKCDFAVNGDVLEHFDVLNLNEEAQRFIAEQRDPIFKEQLKDYYISRQFRKDIYIKGARKISQNEVKEKLLNTNFVLVGLSKNFKDEMDFNLGSGNLDKDLYSKVLKFLEKDAFCPKSGLEITEACKITFFQMIQAMMILIKQGLVFPAQKDLSDEVKNRARKYNENMFKKQRKDSASLYLAAPLIASGIRVGNVQQLILGEYINGCKSEKEIVKNLLAFFEKTGKSLLKDGAKIDESESKKNLQETIKEVFEYLPIYKVLGIVD